MESRADDILSTFELGSDIVRRLFAEVKKLGGADEDILRLVGPAGQPLIKKMARVLVPLPRGAELHRWHNVPIEELDLDARPYNCLRGAGIDTVGDLISVRQKDLRAIAKFGEISLANVKQQLDALGLELAV